MLCINYVQCTFFIRCNSVLFVSNEILEIRKMAKGKSDSQLRMPCRLGLFSFEKPEGRMSKIKTDIYV